MARLAHIGLTVGDLEQALGFFTQFLGFEVTARLVPIDPGAIPGITGVTGASVRELAYLAKGEWVLELLHYTAPAPLKSPLRPCDPGYFHLLVTTDAFDAALAAAGAHGFLPAAAPHTIAAGPNAGKRGTYLRHADGYALEVIG